MQTPGPSFHRYNWAWRWCLLVVLAISFALVGGYGCSSECRYDVDCQGSQLCQGGVCIGGSNEQPPPPPSDGGGTTQGCLEGELRPCYTGAPQTRGKGACIDGKQSCSGGVWGPCTGDVKPTPEQCDGVDNDCNGTVDDGTFGGAPCLVPGQKGPCERGVEKCNNGQLSCTQTTQPAAEDTCGNGKDDDCNGTIDDGQNCVCAPGKTQPCSNLPASNRGQGECKDGTQTCGQDQKWGPCIGEVGPTAETCNNKDDNCDGQTDENLEQPCGKSEGTCIQGKQRCENGQWSSNCVGATGPQPETCDGKDNNCDGAIDENLTKACTTPCGAGIQKCQSGQWQTCEAPNVGTETCNNKDDDCDGNIDENLTRPCTKGCGKGTETCDRGQWVNCSAPTPGKEVCDGKDNDCDGSVDETMGAVARLSPDLQKTYYSGAAASNGTQYAYLYREGTTIYFQRLDATGKLVGGPLTLETSPSSPYNLQLLWNGKDYSAFWRYYSNSQYTYKFARVSTTGKKIALTSYNHASSTLQVAWNGLNYGVAWYERVTTPSTGNMIRFTRLTPTGQLLGPVVDVSLHTSYPSYLKIAAAGTTFGLVWSQTRTSGNSEIYFHKVDKDAKKLGTLINISNNTGSSIYPVISSTRSYFLVAYSDNRSGTYQIHSARLYTGTSSTVTRRTVTTTATYARDLALVNLNPSSTVGEYLLTWENYDSTATNRYQLWYQKLSYTGLLRGSAVKYHESNSSFSEPAVAAISTKLAGSFWKESSTGRGQIYFRGLCGF